jgi:hypothetical protein
VKNSILTVAAVVTASCLFAQNAPSDKQPTPQHMDKGIRVSERVLNDMALKRVLDSRIVMKFSKKRAEVVVGER